MFIVVAMWMSALLAVTPPGASGCLTPPVTTGITGRFESPSCPYCAGHRTLDFSVTIGAVVVAPADGTVTFAGVVAGSTYITIAVSARAGTGPVEDVVPGSVSSRGSAYLVTIGGVTANPDLIAGTHVVAGRRIGVASTVPVRLSLRRTVVGGAATYLDPEESLVRWRAPARLIPPPGTAVGRVVSRAWTCRKPL